ncbi:hypothetical protein PybrP1_006681 [[Pythium] brassicae (nom. inval.)]|nr:hypothetical protein PybrP1_006681 [[Pythium] brassicae (nom. inval.)]
MASVGRLERVDEVHPSTSGSGVLQANDGTARGPTPLPLNQFFAKVPRSTVHPAFGTSSLRNFASWPYFSPPKRFCSVSAIRAKYCAASFSSFRNVLAGNSSSSNAIDTACSAQSSFELSAISRIGGRSDATNWPCGTCGEGRSARYRSCALTSSADDESSDRGSRSLDKSTHWTRYSSAPDRPRRRRIRLTTNSSPSVSSPSPLDSSSTTAQRWSLLRSLGRSPSSTSPAATNASTMAASEAARIGPVPPDTRGTGSCDDTIAPTRTTPSASAESASTTSSLKTSTGGNLGEEGARQPSDGTGDNSHEARGESTDTCAEVGDVMGLHGDVVISRADGDVAVGGADGDWNSSTPAPTLALGTRSLDADGALSGAVGIDWGRFRTSRARRLLRCLGPIGN